MKIVVIGLGNYGSAISKKLAEYGHEVIGVDNDNQKVEALKEKITYAITLDCSDETLLSSLPVQEADLVLVTIGEDIGSSLLITALLKKMNVKNIVSRATSPIHHIILEAVGVKKILNPEAESAERFATKVNFKNVVDILNLSENYIVMETMVPQKYIGRKISEIDFRKKFKINIITIKQGVLHPEHYDSVHEGEIVGVISSDYEFQKNDLLILFGLISDIKKWTNRVMK